MSQYCYKGDGEIVPICIFFLMKKNLLGGGYNIYGKYFKPIKDVFPNCLKLDKSSIKGCIGYLKGKENLNKNCFFIKYKLYKCK